MDIGSLYWDLLWLAVVAAGMAGLYLSLRDHL